MAGKSRIVGLPALRRTLRRLPDTARADLAQTLEVIGNRLLLRARGETPVKTGGLRAALASKVAAKTLQLTIGLVTKATRRRFFYGYILDRGRRAQTVKIKRGPRAGANMRIKAIAPNRYDFVFGRRKDFLQNELPAMRQSLIDALQDAAHG